jgi:ribosomal protein L7/L12
MPIDDKNFEDELRALLAAGRKIEAIKQYRAATGAGLAEAKNAVEALERAQSLQSVDSPFENEILSLLEQGRTFEAIRLYRKKTGVGLKEAKDFIESLAADQSVVAPSKSGCLGVVLLLVLVPLAAIVLGCGKADQQNAAVSPSKQPTLAVIRR